MSDNFEGEKPAGQDHSGAVVEPASMRGRRGAPFSLILVTLVIAVGALVLGGYQFLSPEPSVQSEAPRQDSSEQVDDELDDLFGGPVNLKELIDKVQASTVTIFCNDSQGSGWVVDLGLSDEVTDESDIALDQEFPYEVITNHHVIEDCVDTPRKVEAQAGTEVFDAYLFSWDKKNDLALVAISQSVPPLEVSNKPQPGWWAMAVGTPYGLEGSVSVGNVMNTDGDEVISTTPLNSGNSGGPLVNTYGEVIGTNTYVYVGDDAQDWNVAVGVPALCRKLLDCSDHATFSWD